jgi:hypothetical protein
MSADHRKSAELYRLGAEVEDRRADALTTSGKRSEAQLARDKAHNIRVVADRLEKAATEIDSKGISGADAYTIPDETDLASK